MFLEGEPKLTRPMDFIGSLAILFTYKFQFHIFIEILYIN